MPTRHLHAFQGQVGKVLKLRVNGAWGAGNVPMGDGRLHPGLELARPRPSRGVIQPGKKKKKKWGLKVKLLPATVGSRASLRNVVTTQSFTNYQRQEFVKK